MNLQPHQLDDLVELTINRHHYREWTDISLPLQKYYFADRVLDRMKKPEKGGPYLEFKIQHRNTGSYQNTGLYATDNPVVKDLATRGRVPWTKTTVSMTWDVDEPEFQSDRETIVDEIVMRYHSMYSDFFVGMESDFWTKPASSTTKPMPLFGMTYWFTTSATAEFGFNGGNPTGFTAGKADVDQGTFANWANGTFTFANYDEDDLLRKLHEATTKCGFEAPHPFPEINNPAGGHPDMQNTHEHFTTWTNLENYERLVAARNDNHGHDALAYRGGSMVKGNPLRYVPALTESGDAQAANNEWYGVDWDSIYYKFQRGANMRETEPLRSPGKHDVRHRYLDNWGNMCCTNMRNQFVAYKT